MEEEVVCCKNETEEEDCGNDCAAADDDKPVSVHGNIRKLSVPTRRSSKANWTEEEDDILRDAVQQYEGKSWKKIARCLPGRSDVQCLHRWQKVLNPDVVKGPWSKEEDNVLIELVERCGEKKWSEIAEQLPGRMGKQCRERWYNHLKPEINKAAWTDEEERILINAHAEYGNKWSILAKLLPGRTENSVKNHWNCSLKKKLINYTAHFSRSLASSSSKAEITDHVSNTLNHSSSRKTQVRGFTALDEDDPRLKPCLVHSAPSEASSDNNRCNDRDVIRPRSDGDDVCDHNLESSSEWSSYTGLCYEPMQREYLNMFLSTGRFPSTESYICGPVARRNLKDPCDSYSRVRSILRSAAMSYRNVPSIIRKRAIQLLHKGVNDVPKVDGGGGDDRVHTCIFLSQGLRSLQPWDLWRFEGEFRDG